MRAGRDMELGGYNELECFGFCSLRPGRCKVSTGILESGTRVSALLHRRLQRSSDVFDL